MSRHSYSVLARTALGLGLVVVFILFSSAFVAAQTASSTDATTGAATAIAPGATAVIPGATLTPLPTLPPAVSETPAPTLPAYPFPVTTVPPPTPWPTATLPPPSPTAVVSLPVIPLPTEVPPFPTPAVPPATVDPNAPRFYTPAQMAQFPQVPRARGRHVPGVGGTLQAGPVQLTLPGAAHGRPLRLDLYTDTTYPLLRPAAGPELFFTLDLTDEALGTALHHLDAPAELRLNLGLLRREVAASANVELLHFDTTRQRWEVVPTQRQGATLTAQVSDFSAFALSINYGQDWQPSPRLDASDTDLFTGSATFSLPLAVPQGVHGLMPKLTLTYSGQAGDRINEGLMRANNGGEQPYDNESSAVQADWVGLGWSLDVGRITVSNAMEYNDLPRYSIELNGVRERLVCVAKDQCEDTGASTRDHEYKTERDSFLRIVRRAGGGQNHYGVFFEVWDKSGTYYRFGYLANAEHTRGNQSGAQPVWGLSLDQVQDPYGNRMTFDYFEDDTTRSGDTRPYTRAAYPARIRYTFNPTRTSDNLFGSGETFGEHYQREVRFNEELWTNGNPQVWGSPNRTDYMTETECRHNPNDTTKYYYVQRYRLDHVRSYVKPSPSMAVQNFRETTFNYTESFPQWDEYDDTRCNDTDPSTFHGDKKLILTSIGERAGAGWSQTLFGTTPSYQFSYASGAETHLQLTEIQTALGGKAQYAYERIWRAPNGDWRTYYRVTSRTLVPGTDDPSIVQTYSYPPDTTGDPSPHFDGIGAQGIIGYDWTQVTDALGHKVKHLFFTSHAITDPVWTDLGVSDPIGVKNGIKTWLRGREYGTEYIHRKADAGDGDTLGNELKQRVVTHYEAPTTTSDGLVRHVRVKRTATQRSPEGIVGGSVDIHVNGYDSYGNVNVEYECVNKASVTAACESNGEFERRTERWYEAKNAARAESPGGWVYIVDKPIAEGVHGKTDAAGNPVTVGDWWPQVTYYSYDGSGQIPWSGNHPVYGVAGPTSRGELTWVRRADCWQCSPETTAGAQYSYDAFGNRTTATTWDQFASNGTPQGTARTVTTEYDPTKTFVTRVTQPGGAFYEAAYYNEEGYLAEGPRWVWDNNARVVQATSPDATAIVYDAFGRVLTITKPGDSQPTEARAYQFDATRGARLMVSKTQRLDATQTMTTRTFYDGLGRAVLTKAPDPNGTIDANGTARAAVVATYYGLTGFARDERGLKTAETLPYGGLGIVQDDSYSRPTLTASYTTTPRLIYEYDWTGALTRTTRPDQSLSLVTPIREQRVTSAAERGPEFGLVASFNPSFEVRNGSDGCAAGWPCVAGSVERVGTGIDGRFALRVTGTTAQATGSYGAGTLPSGATFSLSWLARRTSATTGTLTTRVTVNGAAVTPASAVISAATQNEWTLYHWTFTAPSASGSQTLAVSFQTPAGVAYEVDNARLSWGEVRERVETADGLGRTATVAERTNTTTWLTTRYVYDPLDRVVQVTDPLSQTVTTTSYDSRLAQQTVTDTDRGTTLVRYGPQGNLVKQRDGRQQWLTLCYDALDRLTAKHAGDVACGTANPLATYQYDDATANLYRKGRRWQMTDSGGTQVTWSYDPRGRVTSEARRIDGVTYTTAYTYNSADLVKTMTYPDGEPVTTNYNGAGRVNGVSGWNTYLTGQTYDLQARPLDVSLGNGTASHATYDSTTQRLATLRREVRAPVTYTAYDEARLSYSYDWFGNVLSLADGVTPNDNQTFSYDSLNRLVGVTGPFAQTFAYDERGNLTRRGGDLASQQQYLYTAGKAHAVSHVGIDPSAPPRFRYDGAGNLTDRGCYAATGSCVQSLVYDGEGRLTDVKEDATARESYRYDGDGVLVKRTTPTSPAAIQVTEHFTATSSAWTTTAASTWGQPTPDGHATTLKTIGAGNWTTTAARTMTVSHGQTARVAFKLSQTSSQAVLALDTGSRSSYHRFGVYENGGKLYQATAASTSGGTSYVNPTVLVDSFAAGVWYILELTVDDAAGDRVSVWRADTPSERYEARWELPANRAWTFRHWAFAGTTWLDDYQEVRPAQAGSNTRVVGKHYEYDSISASQTKRYYAGGQLLATRTGTTLRYVQPDHLGSTTTLTDEWGVVVSREWYAAFGERRRTSDTLITDQLYTGQRLNVLSNLYHYSDGSSAGRFYDPLLARFVQADKATPPGSQGLNAYSYTLNNPLKHNDPDGNLPHVVVGAVVGAGVAYGFQVASNLHDGMSAEQALTQVNWARVGAGAAAGAVGAATFGVGTAIMGTGMMAEVGASALSNVVAGQVAVATENVLSGQEVTEGLGNGSQMLGDAVLGSAGQLARPGASLVLGAKAGDTALARSLGEAGEAAAGISGIKNRIPSLSRTARYRVPDEIINAEKIIREVKNVSELSYTKQLRDYVLWARQEGYTFELLVRKNGGTSLSQPLIDARNNGDLIIREVLP